MLDRGSFFLSFLSELSQEMLLEKHSWCELEQLNYPKQQGDGAGGEDSQARTIITGEMELSSADRQPYVKPGREGQIDRRSWCHFRELLAPTGSWDSASDGDNSDCQQLRSFCGSSTIHTLAPKWVLLCPFSRREN